MRSHTARSRGRGSRTPGFHRRGFCGTGVALAALLVFAHPASAAGADQVAAVWRLEEFSTSYHGFTTLYQCEALESKVARILRTLGAHESARVRASGCELNRPSRTIFLRITAATPVPATAENLERDPAEKSRQELLDRLGVKRDFDPDEQFLAEWRTFALARQRALRLEPGDCELLEHLRDRVFPKLGIEVVHDDVRCSPGHVPMSTPRLDVRALVKAPTPDEAPAKSE